MRPIKFRGKRISDGAWVHGDLMTKYAHHRGATIVERGCIYYEVDPATVGQFTGLRDKNGTEIYEGDIVKGVAYSQDFVGAIIWINNIAGFGVRYYNNWREPTAWEKSSILKQIESGRKDQFAAEVIGNIHDNPELLEVGK